MTVAEPSRPLTDVVIAYEQAMRRLVAQVKSPSDWAPLEEFVNVADFERTGTFMEVQDWSRYTEMLAQWASSIESFETTVHRISELPGLVFYQIEERHQRADRTDVVNSMTVFRFDASGKIDHLEVYLQQPR